MGERASRFVTEDVGELLDPVLNGFSSVFVAAQVGGVSPYLLQKYQRVRPSQQLDVAMQAYQQLAVLFLESMKPPDGILGGVLAGAARGQGVAG